MYRRPVGIAVAIPAVLVALAMAGLSGASASPPLAQRGSALRVPGYPLILAAGAGGGIWYGGAIDDIGGLGSEPAEYVERIDYIAPGGNFLDLGFPVGLSSRFPRYFARGAGREEWFLADENEDPLPLLGEVTPGGAPTFKRLHVKAGSDIRGLAMGDGALWSTSTRRQGSRRVGAILRIRPDGAVKAFSRGLLEGADPANITAGPDGAMWFTDTAGRIGRIDMDGAIHEFPIGRGIVDGRPPFEPSRPIIAGPEGTLWFIAGPESIGRMRTSGAVSFLTPRSSYSGTEARGENGELVGLAEGPGGEVWFTRDSGEVGRIDRVGGVETVTNRLAHAYGIAFGGDGAAWVGEGPRYVIGLDVNEGELPARVAKITARGVVRQYPPLPGCHVPRLLGLERAYAEDALVDRLAPECERLQIGPVTVRHQHRRGRMIVVSQTPSAGTPTIGYRDVKVTLEAAPPLPKTCRAPAYYKLLVNTPEVIVWEIKKGTGNYPGEEFTDTDYACSPPNGRKVTVGEGFSGGTCGGSVLELLAAGSFVAVTESSGCQYGSSEQLSVFDLRRDDNFKITTGSGETGNASEALPLLTSLGTPIGYGASPIAVDASGDVAWVGETEEKPGDGPAQAVLYLHDGNGSRRIASGPHISDVAFHGGLLTWEAQGVAQSAQA